MLVTTGEQVTIALLAMALHEKGHDAVSMTGWQRGWKQNRFTEVHDFEH